MNSALIFTKNGWKGISNMPQQETLTDHLVLFFRKLRQSGFILGPHEMGDAIHALQSIDILDMEQFKRSIQIVICSTKEEQEKFDSIFQEYFIRKEKEDLLQFQSEIKQIDADTVTPQDDDDAQTGMQHDAVKDEQMQSGNIGIGFSGVELEENTDTEEEAGATLFSALNIIAKNPRKLTVKIPSYNFKAMEIAAKRFITQVKLIDSRRKKVSNKGTLFDMRRTFRKSLQTGAYPIHPVYLGPVKQESKIILLCDSSRSMASYSKVYLQFAHALMQFSSKVEVFLFSTELKRVTAQLQSKRREKSLIIHVRENEWEGGTCIGECLYTFVQKNGPYLLDKNTIVLIASDGLDTGDNRYLQRAMQDIYHRSAFVIWFNPLLNIIGYEPEAKGMKTALPYIDIFSKAVKADSFLELSNRLKPRR